MSCNRGDAEENIQKRIDLFVSVAIAGIAVAVTGLLVCFGILLLPRLIDLGLGTEGLIVLLYVGPFVSSVVAFVAVFRKLQFTGSADSRPRS